MSDTDLLDWADSACSGMGKGFTDYRRHGELDSLGEIGLALITLQAVVLTLKERVET